MWVPGFEELNWRAKWYKDSLVSEEQILKSQVFRIE